MKDIFVDVQMEFDALELAKQSDPPQYVVEACRAEAEALCERNQSRLKTDSAPEFIVNRALRKDTRALVVVVASRWAVTAPECVETRRLGEPIPQQRR